MINRQAPLFFPEIYERARHQNIDDLRTELIKSNFQLLQRFSFSLLVGMLIANIASLKSTIVWITYIECLFATGLTRYFARTKPIKGQFILLYGSVNWLLVVAAYVAFDLDFEAQWALTVVTLLLLNCFILQRLLLEQNSTLLGIMALYFFESLLFSDGDARKTLVAISLVPEIILLVIRRYMMTSISKTNQQSPQSFNFLQGSKDKNRTDASARENKLDVSMEHPNINQFDSAKPQPIQKKLNFEEDGFEIKIKEKDDLGVIDNIYGDNPSPEKGKKSSPPQNDFHVPKFEHGSATTDDGFSQNPDQNYVIPMFNPNVQITEEEIPNPFEKRKQQNRVQSEADNDESLTHEDIFPKIKKENLPQVQESEKENAEAKLSPPKQNILELDNHAFPDKVHDDKPFLANVDPENESELSEHEGDLGNPFDDIYGGTKEAEKNKDLNLFEDFPGAHAFNQDFEVGGGDVQAEKMPDNMKKSAAPKSEDNEVESERQIFVELNNSNDEEETIKTSNNPFAKLVSQSPLKAQEEKSPEHIQLEIIPTPIVTLEEKEPDIIVPEAVEEKIELQEPIQEAAAIEIPIENNQEPQDEILEVLQEREEEIQEKKVEFDQFEEREEHKSLKAFDKSTIVFTQGLFDQNNKTNQAYIALLEKCLEINDSELASNNFSPDVAASIEQSCAEYCKLLVRFYDPSKLQFKNGSFDTRYAQTSKFTKLLKRSGLNFEETLKKLLPVEKPTQKPEEVTKTPEKRSNQTSKPVLNRGSIDSNIAQPQRSNSSTVEPRLSLSPTLQHQKSTPVEEQKKQEIPPKINNNKPEAPKKVNLDALISFESPEDKKKSQKANQEQTPQESVKPLPIFSQEELALLSNPKPQSLVPQVQSNPVSEPKIDYGAFFSTGSNEKSSPSKPQKEIDMFAEEVFSGQDESASNQHRKSLSQEDLRKRAEKLLKAQQLNNLFSVERDEIMEPQQLKEEDEEEGFESYYTLEKGAQVMKSEEFPFDLRPDDPAMVKLKDQIRRFNKLKLFFNDKGKLDMSKKSCKEFMKLVVRTREDPDLYVLKAKQELNDMLRYFDKAKLKFKSDGSFDMKNSLNKDFVKLCQLCGESLEDQLKMNNRK